MAKNPKIHKDLFDAALTLGFRELVEEVYAELVPIQEDIV
ncbi:hypothetical protein THII_1073 [Thioploca ingrica]|uniref:Uncharacterized protein n=1 Tax=Thioploca ingrica TaxID=40754 RepID=A0A090AK54_9GAMM|nr:hypothetical protein THII_1073 [Thioploca ingrica]